MRFNLSTVILSLVVASSVIAAPAPGPNASELEKRSWLGDKITEWYQEVKNSFNCGACVTGLVTIKNIAWLKRSWALDGLVNLCPLIKMDADVCSNFIYTEGAVLVDSLLSADITGGDGKFICFHVGGLCGLLAITSGTLTFPKPKPVNATIPTPSGTLVDVLHLSEHCVTKPSAAASTQTRPQRSLVLLLLGDDYNCDAPPKLATSMLDYVPSVANISFGIMTGDIPPHDAWLETPEKIIPQLKAAFDAMAIVKAKIYPAIGNHEASPLNMFPTPKSGGDIAWLYNTLADDWTRWLTSEAVKSFKNYGSYTLNPAPGLRIVSLNTNFCYIANFYLYGHTSEYNPHGEVQWLIQQLQAAEDIGERVWIIGHIPPSQVDCINNWSSLYRQVVARYSPHVIAEQFFGHSHYDEFSLTYGPGGKSAQNAVSTAWIGPSVTPYTYLNPAFRVYKVDTKSWNVFESLTYVADLDKSASWDATGSSPNWHLEYSARQAHSAYVPIAADQPLSAGWWHNVTNVLESNPAAFKQYWSLRGHSANRLPECTQANGCVADIICDLRAGMRSEICSSVVVPLKKRDDDHSHETSAAGADMIPNPAASVVTGIRSIGEWGPNAKPWNKKLC
ncbi:MAG: Metallo-dependent phosphatase-like protein [Linnemannia elongata]|nr:MAG: Metallo-dependent phosphatase-like protein [Linnemannia elongata]